jgi:hypothetical protein
MDVPSGAGVCSSYLNYRKACEIVLWQHQIVVILVEEIPLRGPRQVHTEVPNLNF